MDFNFNIIEKNNKIFLKSIKKSGFEYNIQNILFVISGGRFLKDWIQKKSVALQSILYCSRVYKRLTSIILKLVTATNKHLAKEENSKNPKPLSCVKVSTS